jgi:hypothetical protein
VNARPALHVVNTETGEVHEHCPGCAIKDDEIEGLQGTIRSQAAKITALKRDRERDAREHQLWPTALEIVKVWRVVCNHGRASFGAAEFELIRPILQDKQYGHDLPDRKAMCLRAVAGAAFDAFRTQRRNGSWKRHDDLDLIFRSRSKFQEFCNRAPADWEQRITDLQKGGGAEPNSST